MSKVTVCVSIVVLTLAPMAGADVISPNILANDLTFSAGVTYSAGTHILTASLANGVTTIRPDLAGIPYPVYDLSGNAGAQISLHALFDHTAVNPPWTVDGIFKTTGADCDLVITGKIPDLGIQPGGSYTGTLLTARVLELEIYGDAGSPVQNFNGFLVVLGGDLVKKGLMHVGDGLGMASWLMSFSPLPPSGFNFQSDFSATVVPGSELGTVPEPATMFLLGTGALTAFAMRRRRAMK